MTHNLNARRARIALACVPLAALHTAAERLRRLPGDGDLAAGLDEAIRQVAEARAAVRRLDTGNAKEGTPGAT